MRATASGGRGARALEGLRAAHDCRACPLWKRATQTVFRFVADLRAARALLAPEASVHP